MGTGLFHGGAGRATISWRLAPLMAILTLGSVSYAALVALEPFDPIFGTWINQEYDRSGDYNAKWEIFTDGREFDYKNIRDTVPSEECVNTFDTRWIDENGYAFYRIRTRFWIYPSGAGLSEGYLLAKIDPTERTMESNFSELGFPERVDELGSYYRKMQKQDP